MKNIFPFLILSLTVSNLFGSADHLEGSSDMYGGIKGTALFNALKPTIVKSLAELVRKVGTTTPDNTWVKVFVEGTVNARLHIARTTKSDNAEEFGCFRTLRDDEYMVTPLHEVRYVPFKREVLTELFARLDSRGAWVEKDNLRTRLRALAPKDWPLERGSDSCVDFTSLNETFDVCNFREFIARGALGSMGDAKVPSYSYALIEQARNAKPLVCTLTPPALGPEYMREELTPESHLLRFEVEYKVRLNNKDIWIPGHGFMSVLPERANLNEDTLRKLPLLLVHTHAYFLSFLEPSYVDALKIAASTDPTDEASLIQNIGRFVRLWCLHTPMKRGSAACADFMMEALFAGKGFKASFEEETGMNVDNLSYAAINPDEFDMRFKAALSLTPLDA